ncbi:helix-turn-helix domain-containing protein [Methylobrevis pamukkalensis]|uniref:HTH-type transcriptional regulator PuuR n=1 Tax=Methylobrevis pamukkalensis TaxID=1439726 RepID=A0A1E3H7K6_9HYPH|nr:helix-turn-helix domain-containing protein [Methylobrevis pamukkalensis]ODN72319.1 HTH-type transcriptional regulator PuuR [Methylobrevis pamukkalensis]
MDMPSEGGLDSVADATASALAAIGNRIREARLGRGMTLQAIAQVSGVSPSMLSLVERGRASPSIGSLIVIANALGITMSELVATPEVREDRLVVHSEDAPIVETAKHVVRRMLREDRERGVSVALNEYEAHTGSAERPISHEGFEYGFILEGQLTVEVDGISHQLKAGDLIAYDSRRQHKIWNHGGGKVRTLWFNLDRG